MGDGHRLSTAQPGLEPRAQLRMRQGLPDTLGWSEQGASQVPQIIVLGMHVSVRGRVLRIHPPTHNIQFHRACPIPLKRDPSSFLGSPRGCSPGQGSWVIPSNLKQQIFLPPLPDPGPGRGSGPQVHLAWSLAPLAMAWRVEKASYLASKGME